MLTALDKAALFLAQFPLQALRYIGDVLRMVKVLMGSSQIGKQVNMVSQSWDGTRLYFTSSLLARWDKKGDDNKQFLRAYTWDGRSLTPTFELDFTALGLGRPHHMLFG